MMLRSKKIRICFCSSAIVFVCGLFANLGNPALLAQENLTAHTLKPDDQAAQSLNLSELDWLVGRWLGSGLGGECEEVFLPEWHNTMTGSFRFVEGKKLIFSEYFSIVTEAGKTELRLKHFNPDLTAWEDKDKSTVFQFIRAEKHAVFFRGLTYQLISTDKLVVFLAMKDSVTGEYKEERLEFTRAK